MYEIYYTSAPQGLKPNARGFCTVAATEGLPRALWERLEALSAYRHHFAAGDTAAQNPVSHAHWLLSVAGTPYHVLSRVCDSGMDYTQRTNAFAHHVALEPGEIATAQAGPAALIEHDGLLRNAWDGQVGAIPRSAVPAVAPVEPAFCAAWQNLAGDAGWAGVLAESFARTPPRPVCILFAPGQELLPLIAEAIALLPPALRWQVTFNTYFTSMPPSATCAWRCCLAGAPAADAATRYAASGIVLNLADRARLPVCPETPWTAYARGGPKPVFPHGMPQPSHAPAKPEIPASGKSPPPPSGPPSSAPSPAPPLEPLALELSSELLDVYREAEAAHAPSSRPLSPGLMMMDSEEAQSTDAAAPARSARWLLIFALLIGVAVVGVSIYLIVIVLRPAPEPPVEHANAISQGPSVTPPADPSPMVVEPQPSTIPPPPHDTQIRIPPPALLPVLPHPTPSPPTGPVQPVLLEFKTSLKSPAELPASIGDKTQVLAVAPADAVARATALQLQFPAVPAPRPTFDYDDHETTGTFSQEPERSGHPDVTLLWKTPLDPAPTALASLRLDPDRGELTILWKARVLTDPSRAKVVSLAYWLLQNSTLLAVDDRAATSPQLHFPPRPVLHLSLTDAATKLAAPLSLPTHAAPKVIHGLPDGWDANAQEETEKDAAGPVQVLYLARAGAPAAATADLRGWFTIKFQPGWAQIDCNLTRQRQENDRKNTDAQKSLAEAEAQIKQFIAEAGIEMQSLAPNAKTRRQDKLTADLADPTRRKADALKTLAACKLVSDDLAQIKSLEVAIDLPGGLHAVTLQFADK